jgi:hypothetical protein
VSPIIDTEDIAGLSFRALQDEVLNHDLPELYRPRVKQWLNEAQQMIARRVRLRTEATTVGLATVVDQQVYALPENFLEIVWLRDTDSNNRLLEEVRLRDVMPGTSTGRPFFFALGHDGIYLSPTPNAVYLLEANYRLAPVDMVADDDVSSLPGGWHFVMVSYALSRALRTKGRYAEAGTVWQDFERDLLYLRADRKFASNPVRQIPGSYR